MNKKLFSLLLLTSASTMFALNNEATKPDQDPQTQEQQAEQTDPDANIPFTQTVMYRFLDTLFLDDPSDKMGSPCGVNEPTTFKTYSIDKDGATIEFETWVLGWNSEDVTWLPEDSIRIAMYHAYHNAETKEQFSPDPQSTCRLLRVYREGTPVYVCTTQVNKEQLARFKDNLEKTKEERKKLYSENGIYSAHSLNPLPNGRRLAEYIAAQRHQQQS